MSWNPKIVRKKVVTYKDTTEVSFFAKISLEVEKNERKLLIQLLK